MAHKRATITILGFVGMFLATVLASQEDGRRYGYIRLLEGQASVLEPGSADEIAAEEQSPLLTSDRLRVGSNSRLEAVLADLSHLRLDEGTEVELTALANSADQDAERTSLRLIAGRLLLTVGETAQPSIVTGNSSIFIEERGVVLVELPGGDRTIVTVREGYAEVLTERGSSLVRANESAFIDGTSEVSVEIAQALPADGFENWASDQEDRLAAAAPSGVDPDLGYDAAALEGQGDWIEIESGTAWRPAVDEDWRPYWNGRWSYTPTGLSWVSYDPWGWVPYHYGGWDYHNDWGWLWYPGNVFAAAHVQWYWGSSHVGWVPKRYYHHHHRRTYGHGPSHYAYSAHSDWGYYDRWTFCPTDSLGSRHQRGAHRNTSTFRERGDRAAPTGLISSGSAGLRRDTWAQPGEAHRAFRRRDLESSAGRTETARVLGRPLAPGPAGAATRPAPPRPGGGDGVFERVGSARSTARPSTVNRGDVAAQVLRRGDALSSWGGAESGRRGGISRPVASDSGPERTTPGGAQEVPRGSRYRGVRIWEIDNPTQAARPPTRTGGVRSSPSNGRESAAPSTVRSSPRAILDHSRSPSTSPAARPSSGSRPPSGSRTTPRSVGSRPPTTRAPTSRPQARPAPRSGGSSSPAARAPSRVSSSSSKSGGGSRQSAGQRGGTRRRQ